MTSEQHQQRIVDSIRAIAKRIWECGAVKLDDKSLGEWDLKEVIDSNLKVANKKKKGDKNFVWMWDNEYLADNNIYYDEFVNITHDTGKLSFDVHSIFSILKRMESLCRVPKSKQIVFGRDSNGMYCHYHPLCDAPSEDKYVTPCPPSHAVSPVYEHRLRKKYWCTQRVLAIMKKHDMPIRNFFFIFHLPESA